MQKTVSIFIPAYNAAAYLEETIRGIVDQTFQDWDLVVVDNASTDSTPDILLRLAAELRDPRIRFLTNQNTLSMVENWNIGLQQARGEFIKLICADDIPAKDCLERQVRALRDHPGAILASGARMIINSQGKKLFMRDGIRKKGIHFGARMIRRSILAGTNIIGDPVCVMWRRNGTEKMGFFDTSILYCTDLEYWLRLLSIGDLYYDTVPVAFYRIHKSSAGVGLAGVVVDDFLRTAKLNIKRSGIQLTDLQLKIAGLKSLLMNVVRQIIYGILG
jgi:glycosyltransferase involved in cell wall biosynthesis